MDVGIDFLGISAYFKDYANNKDAWQLTICWAESFELWKNKFVFKGFADYWFNNDGSVFITEPQLRLPMSNFVKNGFLNDSTIGVEIEITHDFFGSSYGWEINPTIFWEIKF